MTMITPSYLGETIEYSSLHACRSTLEDPTPLREGGLQFSVSLMQADGSQRRLLGTNGRPKWSPEGRQFFIVDSRTPRAVALMDVRPEKSGPLQIAGQIIFSQPSWAGDELIVAVLGSDAADTIALIDVREPSQAKIKEVLWKKGKGLDGTPSFPLYSAATRRGFFVGAEAKGMALYSFRHGQPDSPRRLEPAGYDKMIMDLASSPDGRYLLFASDRPGLSPRSAAPGDTERKLDRIIDALNGLTGTTAVSLQEQKALAAFPEPNQFQNKNVPPVTPRQPRLGNTHQLPMADRMDAMERALGAVQKRLERVERRLAELDKRIGGASSPSAARLPVNQPLSLAPSLQLKVGSPRSIQ